MPATQADLADWVGRTEERLDTVTPGPLARLSATLDREDPMLAKDDAAYPLGHWLFFLPDGRHSALGRDGHPSRGGFLPPIHDLPRRMWAGSRVSFPGEIRVGEDIVRRSTIKAIKQTQGASGPLAFVTVHHEIRRPGADVSIVDEHDIVYLGLERPAVTRLAPSAGVGEWRRTLVADAVMLFRYSALTFNAHRIHFDRDYATRVEGYPGLVVHGPLIATLLIDLVRRMRPAARIARFSFKAISPLFDGQDFSLNGTPPDAGGLVKLWAADPEGRLAMSAEARLATDPAGGNSA
jgi:3-methylfumaryl-CoA hydratase